MWKQMIKNLEKWGFRNEAQSENIKSQLKKKRKVNFKVNFTSQLENCWMISQPAGTWSAQKCSPSSSTVLMLAGCNKMDGRSGLWKKWIQHTNLIWAARFKLQNLCFKRIHWAQLFSLHSSSANSALPFSRILVWEAMPLLCIIFFWMQERRAALQSVRMQAEWDAKESQLLKFCWSYSQSDYSIATASSASRPHSHCFDQLLNWGEAFENICKHWHSHTHTLWDSQNWSVQRAQVSDSQLIRQTARTWWMKILIEDLSGPHAQTWKKHSEHLKWKQFETLIEPDWHC